MPCLWPVCGKRLKCSWRRHRPNRFARMLTSSLLRLLRPLHLNATASPSYFSELHLQLLYKSINPKSPAELEAALRPILFPTESLSDAASWRKNLRFVSWLRNSYLASLPSTQSLLPAAALLVPTALQTTMRRRPRWPRHKRFMASRTLSPSKKVWDQFYECRRSFWQRNALNKPPRRNLLPPTSRARAQAAWSLAT